jgi:hypothetical protein
MPLIWYVFAGFWGLRPHLLATQSQYFRSILQCQAAALDELFGNPADCSKQYQTAQILLHSLCQQVGSEGDKQLLLKCNTENTKIIKHS